MKENDLETSETLETPVISVVSDDDFIEDLGSPEIRPGGYTDPSSLLAGSEEVKSDESNFDKFKSFFGNKKEKTGNAPKTNEKRPKFNGKRVSGAQSIGDAYSAIGGIISRSERHRPSGMLLQWQSAAAGEIIDEAIKDTALDRILIQRAVKARGRFDMIGSVLFPPAIVFAIEMNPDRAPMLLPLLESSLRNSLPHMVPAIKKARKREADQAEAIKELFPDAPEGIDPVQQLIGELFAGWYPEQPAETQFTEEQDYAN